MTHPNAPSTERLREAEELAEAILSAAGSSLKYYVPEARTEIVGVAVRKLDALTQENARLREALRDMIEAFQPFTSKPMGAPGSSARREQETQVRVHAAARRALNGGTSDAE